MSDLTIVLFVIGITLLAYGIAQLLGGSDARRDARRRNQARRKR